MQSVEFIKRQETPVDYFIVVDNASTDDTIVKLNQLCPTIELVSLKENLGYAAGLAAGMRFATDKFTDIDYFWLMDDDSQPSPTALTELIEVKRRHPLRGILSLTGFVDTVWNGPVRIAVYSHKQSRLIDESLNLYSVDHALIDGALVDFDVVSKIGYPDGSFFMMCEDVDYCKRAKDAGFQLVVKNQESSMTRLHVGGGGGFTKSNLWRGYYGSRNHLVVLRRYFTWRLLIMYIIRQSKYLFASLLAPDRFKRIKLRLLGIYHGFIGRSGKVLDPINFR